MPETLLLRVSFSMANCWFSKAFCIGCLWICLCSAIHATRLKVYIFVHLFVRAGAGIVLTASDITTFSVFMWLGLIWVSRLLRGIEAFEYDVCELSIHEWSIYISQNARWLCLNNADVVDASRANPNNFAVHKGPNKFRCLADCLYSVIVCWLKRWRWHQWAHHSNIRGLFALMLLVAWGFTYGMWVSLVLAATTMWVTIITARFTRRRVSRIAWTEARHEGDSIVVSDTRETNLFEWVPSFFVEFILKLT